MTQFNEYLGNNGCAAPEHDGPYIDCRDRFKRYNRAQVEVPGRAPAPARVALHVATLAAEARSTPPHSQAAPLRGTRPVLPFAGPLIAGMILKLREQFACRPGPLVLRRH